MLANLMTASTASPAEVNNFLKNEHEILNDLKIRMAPTSDPIRLSSLLRINYHRVINELSDDECNGFLADTSLFMEENY